MKVCPYCDRQSVRKNLNSNKKFLCTKCGLEFYLDLQTNEVSLWKYNIGTTAYGSINTKLFNTFGMTQRYCAFVRRYKTVEYMHSDSPDYVSIFTSPNYLSPKQLIDFTEEELKIYATFS